MVPHDSEQLPLDNHFHRQRLRHHAFQRFHRANTGGSRHLCKCKPLPSLVLGSILPVLSYARWNHSAYPRSLSRFACPRIPNGPWRTATAPPADIRYVARLQQHAHASTLGVATLAAGQICNSTDEMKCTVHARPRRHTVYHYALLFFFPSDAFGGEVCRGPPSISVPLMMVLVHSRFVLGTKAQNTVKEQLASAALSPKHLLQVRTGRVAGVSWGPGCA
ncbi:hypothetical protein C8Q73DRAFT_62869 [Cubamyces lactineus]|nr:hypothetical protein C8Q73DRAFT_62869 [Cubamyces lactineus]